MSVFVTETVAAVTPPTSDIEAALMAPVAATVPVDVTLLAVIPPPLVIDPVTASDAPVTEPVLAKDPPVTPPVLVTDEAVINPAV